MQQLRERHLAAFDVRRIEVTYIKTYKDPPLPRPGTEIITIWEAPSGTWRYTYLPLEQCQPLPFAANDPFGPEDFTYDE